jgi:hypothetical protein
MMRITALAALLLALPACRFDTNALGEWPVPNQDASADSVPDSGLPDLARADTVRDTAKSDVGQEDTGQSDTLPQSDADVQSDGPLQSDTLPQTDALQSDTLPQQDGPLQDPCVGLVADYTSTAGYIDHCNDGAGHALSSSGGHVTAPAGICRIICWTQPTENASILPDSCSGTWDVLVGGPSNWTSAGCVNVIFGASPYVHGCNSDRRCEVPKYPP